MLSEIELLLKKHIMVEPQEQYLSRLEEIAAEIQASQELSTYLENEEEEDYNSLKELFEPRIGKVYEEVAENHPLQLMSLELVLLDPLFEGLYLPRVLGYSVLRGEVDESYKYKRPQHHFREVLLAICNSANFDLLKKRIGQSIQVGFFLSSDIWITNLFAEITNKRVRFFLQSQKQDRYRDPKERQRGYRRYAKQFRNDNFMSAEFPETLKDLPIMASQLKAFLLYRVEQTHNNESLIEPLKDFVGRKEFQGKREHLEVMTLFAMFFELNEEDQQFLGKEFNKVRKNMEQFDELYLEYLKELHHRPDVQIRAEQDERIYALLDLKQKGALTEYYELTHIIHTKGYLDEEAQEAVKLFYNRRGGLSTINECLRQTILRYFDQFMEPLQETGYHQFFEIAKIFPPYMGIFANQEFNQHLKHLSMAYVKKLLRTYTDKRGRDYQDIKKFVSTTFQDFGFLREKEVVELFKTRRKKKKAEQ